MRANIRRNELTRVVVVGGGLGGIKMVMGLRKSGFQVVLIDKNNYNQFPPLIYQVASAGLEPSSISFPFRRLLGMAAVAGCALEVYPWSEEQDRGLPQLDVELLQLQAEFEAHSQTHHQRQEIRLCLNSGGAGTDDNDGACPFVLRGGGGGVPS